MACGDRYGDDDYKNYARMSLWGDFYVKKTKPQKFKRDFRSEMLNTKIYNLNTTPSALYAMSDWWRRRMQSVAPGSPSGSRSGGLAWRKRSAAHGRGRKCAEAQLIVSDTQLLL